MMYENSVLTGTSATTDITNTDATEFPIGATSDGSTPYTGFFIGSLDEMYWFDTAFVGSLGTQEVVDYYLKMLMEKGLEFQALFF